MRRHIILFGIVASLVAGTMAPAAAGQAIKGRNLEVTLGGVEYDEAAGTMIAPIEIDGVWDDTDIVHVSGTARFRYRIRNGRAQISQVEFIGVGFTGTSAVVQVRGRLSGVFIDDIIIGVHDFFDTGVRGLLLPAVQ